MKNKIVIIATLICLYGCTKEQICNFLHKADLICRLVPGSTSIIVGQIANITNTVTNAIAVELGCTSPDTETAPENSSLVDILFRENPNNPWIIVAQATELVIQELLAGQSQNDELGIEFNQAGEYSFVSNADAVGNRVDERSEINNDFTVSVNANGKTNGRYSYAVLQVLPDQYGNTKIDGKPQVVIVSRQTYIE